MEFSSEWHYRVEGESETIGIRLHLKLRPAVKAWPVILAVLLLVLACGPPAGPEVVPTVVSTPANTVPAVPTDTVAPTPTNIVVPTPADIVMPTPIITVAPTPTMPATAPVPAGGSNPATPAAPMVSVGEAVFTVEVADTPGKRSRGLSGRPSLEAGWGMLFVFDSESLVSFWMPEMHFPLDFVWISSDCLVADITRDVPPPLPETDLSQLPRYRPAVPVQYVLEVNGGEIAAAGINPGDPVGFEGGISDLNGGCQ